ncbi:MAG TPA: hypothetical protein VKG25_07060, partial [Bryobacteraceae bacterium]|nr:hypothetical protein [Bryobacteraceae bacterium]
AVKPVKKQPCHYFQPAPLKTLSKFLVLRDRPTASSSLWGAARPWTLPDGRGSEGVTEPRPSGVVESVAS